MQFFYDILGPALISLFFLALVFTPLEKVFPAKKQQRFFRKHWILDLTFFLGQYLIWGGFVLYFLHFFELFIHSFVPLAFHETVQKQAFLLQVFEVVVLSDILIYWGHRLQHKYDFLWRFHKIHHSAERLDWLAAHREHPLDTIYTVGIINLPAIALGFPLESIAGLIAFRGIWAIYIHSNVRLPLGPLKVLIGSPELHHWHHDLDRRAGNYANISPLMDVIFGTYTCPDHEPEKFGIDEKIPSSYIGQLIHPLTPKKWQSRKAKN
ncbi:MAG: sterol desaturase family protein [Bacteroidota bacterium]